MLKSCLLCISFMIAGNTSAAAIEFVSPSQKIYSATPIEIQLSDVETLSDSAWVGVFEPESLTRRVYIDYVYVNKQNSLTLTAPTKRGEHLLALFTEEDAVKPTSTLSFNVEIIDSVNVQLTVNKQNLNPTESVEVNLSLPGKLGEQAWVGIFPEDQAHNTVKGYLSYQYIKQRRSFIFTAPEQPGKYQFRLFDSENGNELAATEVNVKNFSNLNTSMTTDSPAYGPNANMTVSFKAHPDFPQRAWIGVFKYQANLSSSPHKDYMDYHYLEGQLEGQLQFKTPTQKGHYQLRMFASESGALVAQTKFDVSSSLSAEYLENIIEEKGKVSLYGIYFDHNKSVIKQNSVTTIAAVADLLNKNAALTIEIQGHTDNTGEKEYNKRLSRDRANAVKMQLIHTYGINGDRLSAIGLGEEQPINSNGNPAERALNRRVDILKTSK